jgi:hypothetical protein
MARIIYQDANSRNRGPPVAIKEARRWESFMMIGAILGVFVILGLFLSMLADSPKADTEAQSDTEL